MLKEDLQKLKKQLKKHPGILGKEEYFNSVVLVPLVWLNSEYHFLFEKRAEHIRQGGEICFPGGEIDDEDHNYEATAIRETEEEIGISRDKINVIGGLDTLIGPRGVTVDSCIAELNISSIDECKIDKEEVAKVFTVPVSYFEENEPMNYKVVSEIKRTFYNEDGEVEELVPSLKKSANDKMYSSYRKEIRHFFVYKTKGEVIWGITAKLVYEVVKLLK